MLKAVGLGRLINTLLKERDMTLMHIGNLIPTTRSFLYRSYDDTDVTFAGLWAWPTEFESLGQNIFTSKTKLLAHISQFRTLLDKENTDMYEVIAFYSEIVEFLMEWMITRIKESGFGENWKTLVAFQKITSCMLHAGAERAYGSIYFAEGFTAQNFENYLRRVNTYAAQYKGASFYSDLVDSRPEIGSKLWNASEAIRDMSTMINFTKLSALKTVQNNSRVFGDRDYAGFYFDNMSIRINHLYELQELLARRNLELIGETISEIALELSAYGVILSMVVFSFPLIFLLIQSLTTNLQNYSKLLSKTSDDLNYEKDRTDSLLYRMLPKPIADRMKRKDAIDSEFYKSATILFTSVVGFTQLSISLTALELVELLNVLYTSIDERLDNYDVYKVETINDTYMVVSGKRLRELPVLLGLEVLTLPKKIKKTL